MIFTTFTTKNLLKYKTFIVVVAERHLSAVFGKSQLAQLLPLLFFHVNSRLISFSSHNISYFHLNF